MVTTSECKNCKKIFILEDSLYNDDIRKKSDTKMLDLCDSCISKALISMYRIDQAKNEVTKAFEEFLPMIK